MSAENKPCEIYPYGYISQGKPCEIDMFYTYVLESMKDNKWYTGSTKDLKNRIKEHHEGKVAATKYRRPLKMIYFEACLNELDARMREKYLKTTWGKRYLKNRMKNYLLWKVKND